MRSQTKAANNLAKTPSAINHLLNPNHPNKPTQTTMRLLELIVARERPQRFNAGSRTSKKTAKSNFAKREEFDARERKLIQRLRKLPAEDQKKVCPVIHSILLLLRGKRLSRKN